MVIYMRREIGPKFGIKFQNNSGIYFHKFYTVWKSSIINHDKINHYFGFQKLSKAGAHTDVPFRKSESKVCIFF